MGEIIITDTEAPINGEHGVTIFQSNFTCIGIPRHRIDKCGECREIYDGLGLSPREKYSFGFRG